MNFRFIKYSVTILLLLLPGFLFGKNGVKVAVADFEVNGPNKFIGKAVSDIFITELKNDKDLTVLERSQIQQILRERNLNRNSGKEINDTVNLGQILTVDKMIVGSISLIGSYYTITAKLVEVKSGEIEFAYSETCQVEDDLELASRILAVKVLNKLSKTYHEIPQRKYRSRNGDAPIELSITQRYGCIYDYKIPDMKYNKVIPKKIDMELFETMLTTDYYINDGLSIKGLAKYTATVDDKLIRVSSDYTYTEPGYVTEIHYSHNFHRFRGFSLGLGTQYNLTSSMFQPFIGINALVTRYWYVVQSDYNYNITTTPVPGSDYDEFSSGFRFKQNTHVFSIELLAGFRLLVTESFGLSFGGGANIPLYGSQFSGFKTYDGSYLTGNHGYIPEEYKKIEFNEKDFRQPPMYFMQVGAFVRF